MVNIIGAKLGENQRDLSQRLELSLGMTKMLIRRLISKGYIRMRQLNPRKVEYILTPKGFGEKLRKSVKYTLKTVHSMGLIRDRVKGIMKGLYEQGEREFIIFGKSDFAVLIELALRELDYNDHKVIYVDQMPTEKKAGTLLICSEGVQAVDSPFSRTVNLIEEVAKDQDMTGIKA